MKNIIGFFIGLGSLFIHILFRPLLLALLSMGAIGYMGYLKDSLFVIISCSIISGCLLTIMIITAFFKDANS